jgi:hypothetical protein
MNETRFPKPDVPWFHHLHDYESFWAKSHPGSVRLRDGWEVTLDVCGDRIRCDAQCNDHPWGYACGFPPGHDGPHFGARRDIIVTNIRRTAPAEAAS